MHELHETWFTERSAKCMGCMRPLSTSWPFPNICAHGPQRELGRQRSLGLRLPLGRPHGLDPLEEEELRVLEVLDDRVHETRGRRAVDDAVVEREREVHDLPDLDLVPADDGSLSDL